MLTIYIGVNELNNYKRQLDRCRSCRNCLCQKYETILVIKTPVYVRILY